MLLATVLRAWRLSEESAWCDEVLTLSVLDAPTLRQYLSDAFRVDPMARMVPVYHLLQYGWSRLFGTHDVAVRWLSIALGVGSLPLLYGLARRYFGASAACLAVFLLALSQVHIHQSQEARFYALLMAQALISMATLQRALDTGKRRWWLPHGAASILLLWTHAFAPLFFCVQGVWLLMAGPREWRRLLAWTGFHGMVLAAFFLWLRWLDFFVGEEAHAYHLMLITWRDMANTFIVFAGGRLGRENPAAYMPGGVSLDLLLAALFALALAALVLPLLRRRTAWRGGSAAARFLVWTFLPFLLLYLVSRLWANVFFYRYVIYCLPPATVLFAAGLLRLPGIYFRRCAVALALGALAYQAIFIPRPVRADYRTAGSMIAQHATPQTRVLALKEFNAIAVVYNTPLPGDQIETHHGFKELCTAAATRLQDHTPVWAVFYWWDRLEEFEARMEAAHEGLIITRHDFPGMPPLIVYEMHVAE